MLGIDSQAIASYALRLSYALALFRDAIIGSSFNGANLWCACLFSLLYSVFSKSHLSLLQVPLAHGFSGAMAVPNNETFALVAYITTIHALMLVASQLK